MGIRAEIATAIVLLESGEPKTRPFLGKIDPDHQEALVVAKRDVVTRPILLDQFAFQQNRFRFAAHGMRFKIPRGVQHGARFQVGLRQF